MTHNNQILHDDQTRREEGLQGRPPALANFFVTQILTRDPFAVANLIQTAETSGNVIQSQDDARHEMLQTAHLMPDGHPLCKELNCPLCFVLTVCPCIGIDVVHTPGLLIALQGAQIFRGSLRRDSLIFRAIYVGTVIHRPGQLLKGVDRKPQPEEPGVPWGHVLVNLHAAGNHYVVKSIFLVSD